MKRLLTLFTTIVAIIVSGCQKPTIEDIATTELANICVIADNIADEELSRVSLNGNTTKWEVGDRITLGLVANYYSMMFANLEITSKSDISAD